MDSKVWLVTFSIIAVLLIGGTGFYAFSSYGKYSESLSSWDSKVGTIESLERRVPYPNEENTEALSGKVESYKAAVQGLFQSLNAFQRPLNTALVNTEFVQLVKTKVQEFRTYAQSGGLEINPDLDFQLGFDSYASALPAPEMVPILDYELEAIDNILRKLIDSGAERLITFERDAIPGEAGASGEQESGVVHKYPVRFRFEGSHDTFQKFVNTITNDKEFFYILRVLKVRNSSVEGPLKLTGGGGESDVPRFEDPLTKQVAAYEQLVEWGYDGTDGSLAAVEKAAGTAGYIAAKQDARVLMGQELLNVFMVVDITRFLNPEEVAGNAEGDTNSKSKAK